MLVTYSVKAFRIPPLSMMFITFDGAKLRSLRGVFMPKRE